MRRKKAGNISSRCLWTFQGTHITLHILHFHCAQTKGLVGLRCCVCRCSVLEAAKPGSPAATHTHTPTHRDPYCDRRLPGPWQARPSPANSNTVILLIWERPWLWWICPCKYIPFPLTKHHHMSKPQGPTFCRARVASLFTAWELFTFWGPSRFLLFSKHELWRYSDHRIFNLVCKTNW